MKSKKKERNDVLKVVVSGDSVSKKKKGSGDKTRKVNLSY